MDTTAISSEASRWAASTLASDLSFLLARSNALSLAAGNAALRAFGLKVRSYPVLALVCDDLRPTQRELADVLRLDPSQVVSLVDELEGRGLIERQVDDRDRRAKVLVPTAAGRSLYLDARDALLEGEEFPYRDLDAVERTLLADLLRRVAFAPGE
ncbi:MAG: MarR family winged helix-turn-helix transcriptional regulator [Actinobacteria bacterium]|nr:MarR family winged helix-turn-helix transcriptional regulator [Actinomycetota bacterium]